MKRILSVVCCLLAVCGARARDFDADFVPRTLRLDYTFAGTNRVQELSLSGLTVQDGWAGRRTRLDELPLQGNGQITVQDAVTGDTLYRHSFSSLFQEWQTTEEATRVRRSFENCFLVPMPRRPVDIILTLTDTRRRETSRLVHRVDPADILIRRIGDHPVPHRYIHRGGTPERCIDVVLLAEGYTDAEMDLFYADCEVAVEAMFGHEPFRSLRDRFNFVAVAALSEESGVSVPGRGEWKSTAVGSHFDTFYSDRYLTTPQLVTMHNLLAGIPYEHIIVLANTEQYGGGGIYNSYTLTSSRHATFRPVVVHEFGHSFGGLADEYFYDDQYEEMYPSDTEPWEPNITTLVDFASKWRDMLPQDTSVPTPVDPRKDSYTTLGVYEGAGYQSHGVYRPAPECRMKINEAPVFCPVCRRSLERLIRFYTE
ncbi:MAG: IgA Peptidase M64 [Clostridium sp.]|nr:IgA Peptidase M64 [Clostridium sp.]